MSESLCVCVRERERESMQCVCVCVCVCLHVSVYWSACLWRSGATTLAIKLCCFVRFPILLALFQPVTWFCVVSKTNNLKTEREVFGDHNSFPSDQP